MTDETVIETPERVLELAKDRYASGESVRGLPRLPDLPSGGWYSVQPRKLTTGERALYLTWRWRPSDGDGTRSRSLGRLN